MPISGLDLIEMTKEEMVALFSDEGCALCGSKDLPHPDEVQYRIGEKVVCATCYYKDFGEGVEKHPIGHPGMHKGY